ncbi:uncharacterized protein [Miscanthus floridulus]|uniref:uncharacterized protein n=1 Tax=Miscanthus floridulus TaxID=154761 RepID=UPI00345B182D
MGVDQADDPGRRWHDRSLQVAGSAVARPTIAVSRGGHGMPGAPRGESGSTGAGGTAATGECSGGGRQGGPRREAGGGGQSEAKARTAMEGGGGPLAVARATSRRQQRDAGRPRGDGGSSGARLCYGERGREARGP